MEQPLSNEEVRLRATLTVRGSLDRTPLNLAMSNLSGETAQLKSMRGSAAGEGVLERSLCDALALGGCLPECWLVHAHKIIFKWGLPTTDT